MVTQLLSAPGQKCITGNFVSLMSDFVVLGCQRFFAFHPHEVYALLLRFIPIISCLGQEGSRARRDEETVKDNKDSKHSFWLREV